MLWIIVLYSRASPKADVNQSGVHSHLGQPSVSFKKVAGRVNALSIQESTHFSPRRCASLPLRRFSDPINLRTSILESGYREPQSSKTSCKWRRVWLTGQNRDRAVCGGIWMGGCQVRRWGGGEEVRRPSQERVGRFLPKIPPTWCNYRHFMSSIIERIPSFRRKWGHCFIFSVSVKWSNAFSVYNKISIAIYFWVQGNPTTSEWLILGHILFKWNMGTNFYLLW